MMVNFIVGLIEIIYLISIVFLILVLTNKKLRCYVLDNKEYKLWKKYIKDVDKFEYDGRYSIAYKFIIPNTDI
jgi:hypothetical protein